MPSFPGRSPHYSSTHCTAKSLLSLTPLLYVPPVRDSLMAFADLTSTCEVYQLPGPRGIHKIDDNYFPHPLYTVHSAEAIGNIFFI